MVWISWCFDPFLLIAEVAWFKNIGLVSVVITNAQMANQVFQQIFLSINRWHLLILSFNQGELGLLAVDYLSFMVCRKLFKCSLFSLSTSREDCLNKTDLMWCFVMTWVSTCSFWKCSMVYLRAFIKQQWQICWKDKGHYKSYGGESGQFWY